MPFEISQWADIARNYSDTALVGNGGSIAISPRFSYTSLVDHARDNGLLAEDVRQLFGFFNTADFELVLRLVWQAANVNRSLGIHDNRTYQAYVRVRECLIQCVRNVHPEHQEVAESLTNIYEFLKRFRTVLSLNYDLIIYWTMMYGRTVEDQHSFKDCFFYGQFDANWQRYRQLYGVERSTTLVFYPHGSLILCRDKIETEYKISGHGNLLESILREWQGEQIVPLFVSEGTHQQKIASIQGSIYLSTVYREVLTERKESLVIFGWGFGEHDLHLLHRMSYCGLQKVALSVFRGDQVYCNRSYEIIRQVLGQHVLVEYFDSESAGCWRYGVAPV
jgi:hypothetical protein